MNALRRAAQRALSIGERSRLFGASRAFAAKANACPHDPAKPYHKSPLPLEAAGGLLEYSVVYTDRAINHMSPVFCETMKNIDGMMKRAYNASGVVIMPGSGTYGMEAVARQWCSGKKALVIRNGYFSYRWTDIFEQTQIPSETIVMRGRAVDDEKTPAFAPPPLAEVVEMINKEKPAVVFAPHVETSTGIILPIRTSRLWPTPCTRTGGCSCSIPSRAARFGWT